MVAFAGLSIISTDQAVVTEEDWTEVRSPARAARRRRYGHPQRIRVTKTPAAYHVGDVIYAHPEVYERLRRKTDER